jgi:TonB family protein
MPVRLLVYVLLFASIMRAQVVPTSVSATEANAHLLQRVEPTIPSLAKTMRIGGTVKLQITISTSGDVVTVKIVSGHPMLVSSAIEAAKKWKYKPFEVDKKPVQVTTDVELRFPGGMSEDESAVRNKFFPIENECRDLIAKAQYGAAEAKCREAVEISNRLPKEVILERSGARSLLANSIFLQGRQAESIPLYEEALNLNQAYLKPYDADLASDYWNLGRAYAMTGQLSKADELYATAVSTFEAAILNLPEMKDNYTRRLKRSLNEYAKLKEAEGQNGAAAALRKKASAL